MSARREATITRGGIGESLRRAGRALTRLSPIARYVVEGPSMEPSYREGERLVVNRFAYRRSPPRAGDVVVLRDPEQPLRYLIKRVAEAPYAIDAGRVYVLGDNAAASRDSRVFGPVERAAIVGRAWYRY